MTHSQADLDPFAGRAPSTSSELLTNPERVALWIGQLLAFGLDLARARDNPAEFQALRERFDTDPTFRTMTKQTAAGLGLIVVAVDERGVVLAPHVDSPFAMKPQDIRTHGSTKDRLLDGLFQVAIAATVYPRAELLQEDPREARPPIRVSDVERTLRELTAKLAHEATLEPDPTTADAKALLLEAWRVFHDRPSVRPSERRSRSTTTGMITSNLETLVTLGCFVKPRGGADGLYQPTWRYQVQMQEFGATALYDAAQVLLSATPDAVRASARPRDEQDAGDDSDDVIPDVTET